MRLAAVTVQVVCGLLILSLCVQASPKSTPTSTDDIDDSLADDNVSNTSVPEKQLEDEIDLDDAFDAEELKNEQLPILPPIILLDFVNGTDDLSANSTEQGEGKPKRTIDSNLGYGLNNNNIFSGKHNFYFPSGKTGTSVTIEESISPYEPKTVTELVKPISEKSEAEGDDADKKNKQSLFEAMPDPLPLENNREPPPLYPPYPIFGQRTKLQKTSSSDFGSQDQRTSSPKPISSALFAATPGSDNYNKLLAAYASAKQTGFRTGSPSRFANLANMNGYARPMTSSYIANHMSDIYSSSSNQKPSYDLRPSPATNHNLNLADYPRYTVENGIKYEHKIVWKYPDGKISEMPPSSYVNSYAEYAGQQRINTPVASTGFRPSPPFQSRPVAPQQVAPTSYVPYTGSTQNNIYSQKPVQFPNDQESSNGNQQKENRFVSPSSTPASVNQYDKFVSPSSTPASVNQYDKFVSPSSTPASINQYDKFVSPSSTPASVNQYDTTNSYISAYQGQFGLRMTPKPNSYRPITKSQHPAYNHHRVPQKYSVNSPDPEYKYNLGNVHENLFSANGKINKNVLSKYSPEAQQYLMKVFANGRTPQHVQSAAPDQYESYTNTDYSNLLNYNPSISQYIKNPSSILNAQPTFVQAGNSLIPVIILRVDGAPPLQQKAANQNINLKSLLRQYLSQYATSVSKLTQNTNYDLGGNFNDEAVAASHPNPVEDLKHLTESLESLRQRGHQDPDFTSVSYSQNFEQQVPHNTGAQDYQHNYARIVKNGYTVQSSTKAPQKVKSVQIIEDPRYTSYKVDH